ncbi:MAG: acyl-CoA synthase [Deltaproteobacteria bacterium]|nr:MAG: acyl-CoA synthase [Deltaproteobacteria bacterium]
MTEAGMRLAHWAQVQPDAPAVQSIRGDRTFGELNANTNRLVRALRSRGLREGDAVAIVCSNRPEFAEVVHACLRAGLRYTPVNWHLTADEVAYIVGDCEAKALFGDTRFAELMTKAAALCPNATVRLAIGSEIAGFESYDAAIAEQESDDITDPKAGFRMLYTSGTTGRPKGVVRPMNYSTGLTALTSAPQYAPGKGQLNLCTGPMHHGGPLVYSMAVPISQGVGTVLMDRWDAEEALRLIEKHRITHTHMVPTMFHRLLRLPEEVRRGADVSSMQYIAHGAAPCTVGTKEGMLDWFGPILWEYYAATEGGGASVGPEQWLEKPGTVGKPITKDHVQVLDDDGNSCAPNQPGTIYLKVLPSSDFEYFNDPAKTAAAHRGTHFTVGDVGYLDGDGFLFLTDRSADLIVRGGVNIYPAEVEAVLLQHPAVRDVAVVGVPDSEWGEEVKGVVEHVADEPPAELEQELIELCRARLARFKCPQSIDIVDKLPRSDNGKLYKRRLRERYRGGIDA